MTIARFGHTLTLLPNGKVLVAGGFNNWTTADAEVYDPATGHWTPTGSITTARYAHTATLLPNGKVLVAGGRDYFNHFATAEIYDPVSETWTAMTGLMQATRAYHCATLLPNGKVLVDGGWGSFDLPSAELYDPAADTWNPTGSMAVHGGTGPTATLLQDGRVLAVDYDSELYDPTSQTWTATAPLSTWRDESTATLLQSGEALVAGGYPALASAERYSPQSVAWTTTASMATGRDSHTATLLPNGQVLVAGGWQDNYNPPAFASAEIYQPIVVQKANYDPTTQDLHVEATSALGASAALELVGYGAMSFKSNLGEWVITTRAAVNPGTVTVRGVEGSTTAPVK